MFPILLGKNNDLVKRVKALEDSGGGGSIEILEVTINNNKFNKTAKQIIDKYPFVTFTMFDEFENLTYTAICTNYVSSENGFDFTINFGFVSNDYYAVTENDYPEMGE